jgi:cell division protein FtsQ
MARAAAFAEPPEGLSWLAGVRWRRFFFWLIAGALGMMAVLFVWRRTEEFLIQDDRFRLAEPEDVAGQSPSLTVEGVHYASPSQIRHIFAEDFGRSLYLVPIAERREQLLAIDWVEDATVSKLWPNALRVTIHERHPVAFVRLPPNRRDGLSQFALIDRDGYVLRPRAPSRFTLPLISGVSETESLPERRARVRRVLTMLREAGSLAGGFAEINASDPNDLLVTERVEGGAVYLKLGGENFSDRLKYFLANYREVKAKRPDAQMFDLRVDGDITASGGSGSGQ